MHVRAMSGSVMGVLRRRRAGRRVLRVVQCGPKSRGWLCWRVWPCAWSAPAESVQVCQVCDVDVAGLVSAVEGDLLCCGQAWDGRALDVSFGEALARVEEEAAVGAALTCIAVLIEVDRVDVYPPIARSGEFHTHGSPVRLDLVPASVEQLQRGRLAGGVTGQVQITVRPRLVANQCIDSQPPPTRTRQPAEANPWMTARTSATSTPSPCPNTVNLTRRRGRH